jgi:hypothetical protein
MVLRPDQERAIQDAAIKEYGLTRLNTQSDTLAKVEAAKARDQERERQLNNQSNQDSHNE